MNAADLSEPAQEALVLGGSIGGIGPDIRSGILGIDQPLAQPRPVVRRRVGDLLAANDPVPPIDRDMRLVAEGRDGNVDLR